MSEVSSGQDSGLHFLDYWRVIRSRKEIVLAVAILVALSGTVWTLMLPQLYESVSSISVQEDRPEISPFEAQRTYGTSYNPYFLKTQFEVLTSKPLLYEVINRLNLLERWSANEERKLPRDIAAKKLLRSINVYQKRDTSLIEISVRTTDPDLAAKISNELADVYRDTRIKISARESRSAIENLQNQLRQQKERVFVAEEMVQKLRTDLDIADSAVTGINADSVRLQQLEGERLAAQSEMLEKEGLLKILESLADKDLMERSSYITYDQLVNTTRQQILDIDVQLSSLLEDYGENHPEVRRVRAAKEQLEVKLNELMVGLRNGLQLDYQRAKNTYESLDNLLAGYRSESIIAQGEKYRPFRSAVTDLEAERFIYQQLNARLRQEIITSEVPKNPVEIISRAEPDPRPVSPQVFMNVLISIFVGLGTGVGLAYFIEYLDTSIKTSEDVERVLGIPVLGQIPQKVRPLIEEGPDSEHSEAYRVLRTNLAFTEGGSNRGAFCVLSGGAGEGKSTTVFNLAYVCAQQGEKVLLIDADLRRPVQHTILGVSNRFGLTNVLLRDVPVEEAIKATSVPNLHFLPSGRLPRASLGVLDPQRIGELIASLKTKYDVVLIDTPPLVGISDSSIIAKEADGAILVIQYRKYPRDMIVKAVQMMETVGVTAVGAVLNNINIMRDDYYYYYHSYYSDYYHNAPEEGESD